MKESKYNGTKKLTKGIRKRGDRYQVDVTVGGRRKTGTARTYEDAVALRARLRSILEGKAEVSEEWTIRDAIEKTLELPPPDGWRGTSSERTARINAECAASFFGEDRPIHTIKLQDIEEYAKSLEKKGASDSTINRKMSALRKIFKVARKYGAITDLPQFPAHRREPVNRIRQILPEEEDEMLRIFAHLGWEDTADLVTFLIETGVRINEALNMRKEDVQMRPGEPAVALIYGKDGRGTKNGEVRSVPLTGKAVEAVKRQLGRKVRGKKLWGVSYYTVRHRWDRVRGFMGLLDDEAFTIHVCRHTCCSRLVRAGVPLAAVKQWMGHKTLDTTLRYAHLMPSDLFSTASVPEAASA